MISNFNCYVGNIRYSNKKGVVVDITFDDTNTTIQLQIDASTCFAVIGELVDFHNNTIPTCDLGCRCAVIFNNRRYNGSLSLYRDHSNILIRDIANYNFDATSMFELTNEQLMMIIETMRNIVRLYQ